MSALTGIFFGFVFHSASRKFISTIGKNLLLKRLGFVRIFQHDFKLHFLNLNSFQFPQFPGIYFDCCVVWSPFSLIKRLLTVTGFDYIEYAPTSKSQMKVKESWPHAITIRVYARKSNKKNEMWRKTNPKCSWNILRNSHAVSRSFLWKNPEIVWRA